MFAMSMTANAGQILASESGIVLKEVSSVDPGYCHIKYMAFTEQSLKSGDPEFNPNEVIDSYQSCAFYPKSGDEVRKQAAFFHKGAAGDGSNDSDN